MTEFDGAVLPNNKAGAPPEKGIHTGRFWRERLESEGAATLHTVRPFVKNSASFTWLMLAFEKSGGLLKEPLRFRDPSTRRRMFATRQSKDRVEYEIG